MARASSSRRHPLKSVRALDRSVASLAARLDELTRQGPRAKHRTRELTIAAQLLQATAEALTNLVAAQAGAIEPADAVGFEIEGPECEGDVSENHGLDVEYDVGSEASVAQRGRVGFVLPHNPQRGSRPSARVRSVSAAAPEAPRARR